MKGNTGSNFISVSHQISDSYHKKLKVNQETEQKIKREIKQLQDQDNALYTDDSLNKLTDEQINLLSKKNHDKINQLIDSMYETQDEQHARINNLLVTGKVNKCKYCNANILWMKSQKTEKYYAIDAELHYQDDPANIYAGNKTHYHRCNGK